MYVHVYMHIRTYNMYIRTCVHTHRGTSNRMRRRRRAGHSRGQKICRKTKMTTKDDVMMNDDHVIKYPKGTNTGNHGDSCTSNPPPAVFTPAKEIINEGTYVEGVCILMRFCYIPTRNTVHVTCMLHAYMTVTHMLQAYNMSV